MKDHKHTNTRAYGLTQEVLIVLSRNACHHQAKDMEKCTSRYECARFVEIEDLTLENATKPNSKKKTVVVRLISQL